MVQPHLNAETAMRAYELRVETLQAKVAALRAQCDELAVALRRVAAWEFDLNGDCVADARAVASAALARLPSPSGEDRGEAGE